MTPDQLAAARAIHWHQDARPLLTLEDATAWIEQVQLALYLPRKAHVLAPAPSFVEAVAGQGNATPAPAAIAEAGELLFRLVQEGTVVPLNLFGTPGEQPDFLVATTALPHLAALQADRNWKKPPSRTGPGKVSPMAIEVWKLLDREGALTANEIREQLGHELTEAATIRGLSELWQNMRVAPLPSGGGEGAHWQILSVTHKKEMAAGGTMAQSAALSMLVSQYLQSIITGTAEDVEAFLSPVASRSRLRDVVRGLTATRQLRTLSMDAKTFLFIDGTLPEMPELVVADAAATAPKPAFMGRSAYRERMLNRGKQDEAEAGAEDKPAPERERPAFRADRPQRFAAGGSSTFRKRPGGETGRAGSGRPGSGRPGSDRGSFSRPRFEGAAGAPRSGTQAGERPAYNRPAGDRPLSDRSAGDRPFRPAARTGEVRTGSDRPRFDTRSGGTGRPGTFRPGTSRDGASERPRTGRTFSKPGERGSFRPSAGGDRGGKPGFGARPPFRSGGEDQGGASRTFRPRTESNRSEGDKRPFRPREDAGSANDSRNSSRAGFQSRTGGRPGRPAGDRPRPDRGSGDRPSSGRPRPPRAEGDRPYTPRPRGESSNDSRVPRRFDSKPSSPRRDSASPRFSAGPRDSQRPRSYTRSSGEGRPANDVRPPRREGSKSGYPSNPNRPSRAPRPSGSFVKREGGSSDRRPGGRPASGARSDSRGTRPGFSARPPSGDRARFSGSGRPPGRNLGGTSRPAGPRAGGGRPFPARGGAGSSAPRKSSPRPGGMKPPTRKPRPEKDSE